MHYMEENYISRSAAIAWLLWGGSGALVGAVWALALLNVPEGIGRAVAVTTILMMTLALAWQVRLFVQRLCALIRATAGLQRSEADLHTIGRR